MSNPCDDTTTAEEALTAAIAGPASVEVDGMRVESQSLTELIAAVQYYTAKCAGQGTGTGSRRGLRLNRLIPDGCVQDSGRRGWW
jgi:hypothetical protein